jgi:phosphatidylserine decarboxylase
MKFTRYGYGTIRFFLIISLLIDLGAFLVPIIWLKITLIVISILLMVFVLNFFRDPHRVLPSNIKDDSLISPADGRVVAVNDIMYTLDAPFPKGEKLKQVSIFLSAFNVHVNRIPVSGEVNFIKYVKGEYLVAFDHKSSDRNERSEIGIMSDTGKQVVFKQIAGFVARRIIYELKEGQSVKKGERFGMIKFGSRVDILFHPDAKILVKRGDKVTAGETIICEL